MQPRYEYTFVRLGEGYFGVRREGREEYQQTIHEHAAQGWRLVQIFAPGLGVHGSPTFYELIFERPTNAD
jgi:hypothetical protein